MGLGFSAQELEKAITQPSVLLIVYLYLLVRSDAKESLLTLRFLTRILKSPINLLWCHRSNAIFHAGETCLPTFLLRRLMFG